MILEKERKRRKNKTAGVILSSLGVISTGFGIFVLSNTTEDGQASAIKDTVGGLLLGYGVISGGISIPLFKSAKKKRKERDKLIARHFELQ